jgi:hypothetical protein
MTIATMPPLLGNLSKNLDHYRLEWLPDGYPGRRGEDGVWAHPVYGAYALMDYLSQYERHPGDDVRAALARVAEAAVSRMEPFDDALVFWYDEDPDNARSTERRYSGLTQAHYAAQLIRASAALDDERLAEAARRAFASLLIDASRGGVLTNGAQGPYVSELPQTPNRYVLNGWLSTLCAIEDYAIQSESDQARELVRASAAAIVARLPQYDVPQLCTSRYGLTGFVYARLVFRRLDGARVSVRSLRHTIPGEPEVEITKVDGTRWQTHVVGSDVKSTDGRGSFLVYDNQLRLNLVLSRASHPQPNRLSGEITGPACVVEVQLQRGQYDPLTARSVTPSWVTIGKLECPEGTSRLDIGLPWDVAELVAYPTNFAKQIDGQRVNIYHQVHVNRLRELHGLLGLAPLAEWADTWSRYMGQWGAVSAYDGLCARGRGGVVPVAELAGKLVARPAQPADSRVASSS